MSKISVLMSAYNAQEYIEETIKSILNQTFSDFEFIIIDDGSIDNTKMIIDKFNDCRINYYYFENSGLSKSLNRGLKISTGKYIARIDADDICYPTRLEKQYNFMEENPSYVLCGSYTDVIDENGHYIYTFRDIPTSNDCIQKEMEKRNCIVHSSSFYIRQIALSIGGYYEPIKQYFEDYMFFYQFLKQGKAYNFSEPLIKYRLSPGSISTRNKNPKYEKLVQNVIHRGYINDDEKKFLFDHKKNKAKKHIQLSNHFLSLSRLVFIHQANFHKSLYYLTKAIKANPFNLNIFVSFLYMIFVSLLKKSYAKSN